MPASLRVHRTVSTVLLPCLCTHVRVHTRVCVCEGTCGTVRVLDEASLGEGLRFRGLQSWQAG